MKPPPPRVALTRDRILRAGLALVDREGLEALSMRRVGQEVGVEAMSLYNHVADKAALLDGIFEMVLAELAAPRKSASWSAALRSRARAWRAVLRRHPNTLPLFATRPAVTPASIRHVEGVLAVLHEAGFSADHALRALQVLVAFVVGHTVAVYGRGSPRDESRPPYEHLSAEVFPRVREAARALSRHDVDREFEFGLDAMLLGLQKRIKGRRKT